MKKQSMLLSLLPSTICALGLMTWASTAAVVDTDGDGLSDEWEQGVGRYQIIEGDLTWQQARDDAEAKGGHLVTIPTEAEWTMLWTICGPQWNGKRYWLGATDRVQDGTWQWITGEVWSHNRWFPDQPSGGPEHELISWEDLPDQMPGWNDGIGDQLPGNFGGYILEFGYPTDPFNADTDGDGFNDKVESDNGSDPNNAAATPDLTDRDNDGVNYYRETADGTDPNDPNSFNSLSKGLVAYYPFNGNADDESGNERNGVATAITYDTDITGQPASSAVFANGSAVDIPSLTGFQFRPVTYSLWVYFSNIQSNRETTLIGRKRAWAQSDGGVTVETRWAVNNELKYSTGGTIITSGFEFDIGQWYHIVFTQDAQSEASFYVNGELLSSQPFTAVQDTDTFPFRLGAESALDGISSGEGIFNGQMDKVRIYDRALSAQEVTSLYTSEPDMADSDADGLYDFLETQIGTDPNNPDTDGDGLKDGAEHLLADLGFSPLDNNSAQAVTLFSDPNKTFLFTQAQYDLNRSNGQTDVTTSPSTFSLFTQNQVAESYTQGQNSVLQSIPSVDFSVPASTPFRVTLSGQNVIGVVVDDTESPLPDNWRLDEQAGQLIGSVVGSNSISVVLEGEMAGDAPAIRIPLTFYPQAGQTIAPFARIPTQAFRLAPLTVTPPAASSGFAVVLSVKSGPATIVDNQVMFTGVGKVDLAANQVGNKDMKAAPEVTTSFLVTKGRQNMSFPPLNSMPFVQGGTFQLSATTSSALPIAYSSSNPRVISISGSTATIVGRGVATIRATQSGDSNWAPATPISRATRIY